MRTPLNSFDFQPRTRIVFGSGSLERLGALAAERKGTRALVVSDEGVVRAGHYQRGIESLRGAGLQTWGFHDLHENPSTDEVEAGVQVARQFRPDLLIGLGGGSSMDCAKGINFLYSCGGRMQDYWGVGKAKGPMLPMIAVPTTAGTGSESQSFALISDAKTHLKMACGDPRAAFAIAVLDPLLTLTMSSNVTALTGIDALTHALETYVTRKRNGLSQCYSREAWRCLSLGFPKVLRTPDDLEARALVQWGACLSGMAIETSMLGAAHACANPLTARHDVSHGQAVGVMMPHVIRFNGRLMPSDYADLWRDVPESRESGSLSSLAAVDALAEWFRKLVASSGLKTSLTDLQIPASQLSDLSQEAARQWTASFNPISVDAGSLENLYRSAL
jgi:alcohol dehydrogenase